MGVERGLIRTLDAIVVYDLEYTAWEGSHARRWSGPGEHRELVQIGAVRVHPRDGFAESAAFSLLVKPRINPRLSGYFTDLTGITQAAVDADGVDFATAVERFAVFLDGAALALANGVDHDVLVENGRLHGVPLPFPDALFVNVAPWLRAAAGGVAVSSGALHRHFPGVPELQAHDALSDARMVALAVKRVAEQA
ncbi:exonuclease domain-containing protein [Azospirillum sp.]|uniref:exonuclease domain-containing protein n=1 Tax=Azospirillum sp. TaxID=34012 RepID=UPI002D379D0B|nr:exonuclease domain-containing protein [Azospirillum sp.]HYD70692.1 exonuclease domain-containing protein [Azospirillum sp.]